MMYKEYEDVLMPQENPKEDVRDYNYRRHHKIKEQKRRKKINEINSWVPTSPARKVSENGDEYYIEGDKSLAKQVHKRNARRKTRYRDDDFADNGGEFKKDYDLWWNWL